MSGAHHTGFSRGHLSGDFLKLQPTSCCLHVLFAWVLKVFQFNQDAGASWAWWWAHALGDCSRASLGFIGRFCCEKTKTQSIKQTKTTGKQPCIGLFDCWFLVVTLHWIHRSPRVLWRRQCEFHLTRVQPSPLKNQPNKNHQQQKIPSATKCMTLPVYLTLCDSKTQIYILKILRGLIAIPALLLKLDMILTTMRFI